MFRDILSSLKTIQQANARKKADKTLGKKFQAAPSSRDTAWAKQKDSISPLSRRL